MHAVVDRKSDLQLTVLSWTKELGPLVAAGEETTEPKMEIVPLGVTAWVQPVAVAVVS